MIVAWRDQHSAAQDRVAVAGFFHLDLAQSVEAAGEGFSEQCRLVYQGQKPAPNMQSWKGIAVEKDRLVAFSDGVIAVIITIMVLEMKAPHDGSLSALEETAPAFLGYLLSFMYVAIYWNNHHYLFHLVRHVDGTMLWANLHLLFWLSIIPFATSWIGEHPFSPASTAVYGVAQVMAAIAWYLLQVVIIRAQGSGSALARAIGSDIKGKVSAPLYVAGILLALVDTRISDAI